MKERFKRATLGGGLIVVALAVSGCSIKTMAVNTLGNALSEGTSGFAKDEDPELVRDAIPFALKTIESLIDQSPKHRGLLTAACSGFTQYGYAFVQAEADYVEAQDLDRATAMRTRAKKLYLRAVEYGLRSLDVGSPGFPDRLRKDPDAALAKTKKTDVPALYWTAAAWAAAFAIDKADSALSADQSLMEKMMRRALTLDESWELGSIHDFFISWDGAKASPTAPSAAAREHFDRAVALAKGRRASPYVSYAEVVSVGMQNKKEFQELLETAITIDVNAVPEQRLANILSQRRARWLLSKTDELFVQ
jgi:predicted anti-sigma-YlaC factor YlaD